MTQTKNIVRCFLLAFALVAATPLVHAQGGPGDPGLDPDPPRTVPFDGGLSLVVAAGIAYAAKKGRDRRKQQTERQAQPPQTEK